MHTQVKKQRNRQQGIMLIHTFHALLFIPLFAKELLRTYKANPYTPKVRGIRILSTQNWGQNDSWSVSSIPSKDIGKETTLPLPIG
ncbi:MAG TPA: hypothetical protein V6D14_35695 [Coleofasciculaceae cyanobacterium]|jgi:hypothetical protein